MELQVVYFSIERWGTIGVVYTKNNDLNSLQVGMTAILQAHKKQLVCGNNRRLK